jgi:hypothetical protein
MELAAICLSACAKTIVHPIFWKLPPPGAASKKSGKAPITVFIFFDKDKIAFMDQYLRGGCHG